MEKAERIDSVQNVLVEEELIRLLPEVDAIYDEEIRQGTIDYFLTYCPDYFWNRAASASGKYHPPDERGEYGTWLHTKRVFVEYCNLSESLHELGLIDDRQRAAGKAAALIHDTFNYGWPSEHRDMTTSEHDVIAATLVRKVDNLPEETASLVETHMGPWGDGPVPETQHEIQFHLSDKAAAKASHMPEVYYPAEELRQQFAHLGSIEVGDDEVV